MRKMKTKIKNYSSQSIARRLHPAWYINIETVHVNLTIIVHVK